jgi:hypothetical protein
LATRKITRNNPSSNIPEKMQAKKKILFFTKDLLPEKDKESKTPYFPYKTDEF